VESDFVSTLDLRQYSACNRAAATPVALPGYRCAQQEKYNAPASVYLVSPDMRVNADDATVVNSNGVRKWQTTKARHAFFAGATNPEPPFAVCYSPLCRLAVDRPRFSASKKY